MAMALVTEVPFSSPPMGIDPFAAELDEANLPIRCVEEPLCKQRRIWGGMGN